MDRPVLHVAAPGRHIDRIEDQAADVEAVQRHLLLEERRFDVAAPGRRAVALLDQRLAGVLLRQRPGDELPGGVLVARAQRDAEAVHRHAGEAAGRPLRRQAIGHRLRGPAGRRVADLGQVGLAVGRVVDPAGLQRLRRLVGGVGQSTVRSEVAHQPREVFGGGNGLGRIQHRRQVVRRVAEDVAAEGLQERHEGPAVMVVGDVAGDSLLAVHRLQHFHHVVGGVGEGQARLGDEVGARGGGDVGVDRPGYAVELAVEAGLRCSEARQEVLDVPAGRRLVGVGDVLVERGQPAGADPAAGIDEGDVADVIGRAAGRQLEIQTLVVDREGRGVVDHLGAGQRLELGQQLDQDLREGCGERRDVQGGTLERLGAGGGRGLAR